MSGGIFMDIVFVILNYNTYQETLDCISSIERKIDTDRYKIVIVDNKSKDDSAYRLDKFAAECKNICLIKNEENLGYAKGNNVGIRFAYKEYNPRYLAVINSDTELIQENLIECLDKEYKVSKFALLGPLILTADGRCDNSPHYPPTIKHIRNELALFKREEKLILWGLYLPYCRIRFFLNLIKEKVLNINRPLHRNMEFHQRQTQVVLQGSFIVFSNIALHHVDGFDERTFLYYEEPILYLNLMKAGLTTVYDPEIVIYHKDGRATSTVATGSRKKLLFINRCYQESAKILLQELQKLDKI